MTKNSFLTDWDRAGLKKYFKNTGWIAFAKLTSLVVSFFTIIVVARYLGPDNLGKISYAQSFVAIFSALASLGIDQIVYRNLVAQPEKETEILGTAVLTKFFFGFFTFFTTILLSLCLNSEPLLTWLVGIIALTFIFQPFGIITQLFNARVLSKYPSYATLVITFLIPLLKLLIIYLDKGVILITFTITLEAILLSLLNIYFYKKILAGSIKKWVFSYEIFKNLLKDSWPLVLAGVSGYLYARIDQVMLLHYIDAAAVGYYDIAVKPTEFMGFLPGIIIGSLFPAVVNARLSNRIEYKRRLRSLVILCMGISLFSALVLFLSSDFLVKAMFGDNFSFSSDLLKVYVWSTLGTVATALMYNYFVAENKTTSFLFFTVSGALVNVFLNSIFIPKYGAFGAAYATILTFVFTILFFAIYHIYKKLDK